MKELTEYCNRSEPTLLKWIRERGFPARKIDNCWESDTDLVDGWRRDQIQAESKQAASW